MLPIYCHGCSNRFRRTAASLFSEGVCPRCASTDIDVDETGLATQAAVTSRDGVPVPKLKMSWDQNSVWPYNYDDDNEFYWTLVVDAPEPVAVIEGMIQDSTLGRSQPEFSWEVDGRSQWNDDFGFHGKTTSLAQAKRDAEAAVQKGFEQFWAKFDAGTGPKPESVSSPSRPTDPNQGRLFESSRRDRVAAKVSEVAASIRESNPQVSQRQAISMAREAVLRYPSVIE